MNQKTKDFIKWYLRVDLKDWTNYIAITATVFLVWWSVKIFIGVFSLP